MLPCENLNDDSCFGGISSAAIEKPCLDGVVQMTEVETSDNRLTLTPVSNPPESESAQTTLNQTTSNNLVDDCNSIHSKSVDLQNEESKSSVRPTCNYKRDGVISNSTAEGQILNEEQMERFSQDEAINCICGVMDEDGLMIQCDLCKCWQHAICNNIDDELDVPEHFSCCFCQHPAQERVSTKHLADQEWITEGKLPQFPSVTRNTEKTEKRQKMLKKSHVLVGELCYLGDLLSKLRVKTEIAETPNHPKLILWNPAKLQNRESCLKFQKDGTSEIQTSSSVYNSESLPAYPQPEEAIDFTVCQEQLLKHIDNCLDQAEAKADIIENMIEDLERQEMEDSAHVNDFQYSNKREIMQILEELSSCGTLSARY